MHSKCVKRSVMNRAMILLKSFYPNGRILGNEGPSKSGDLVLCSTLDSYYWRDLYCDGNDVKKNESKALGWAAGLMFVLINNVRILSDAFPKISVQNTLDHFTKPQCKLILLVAWNWNLAYLFHSYKGKYRYYCWGHPEMTTSAKL